MFQKHHIFRNNAIRIPILRPKEKRVHKHPLFFWSASRFEEGGRHEVTAKNMPVACFLARGKVPIFQGAVRRTVN